MQSTTKAIVAYAEWVHETVFEPGGAILASTVEFSGQVVSRFQRSVSDGKTAYDRRKQKSHRKALVPFGELVMFMPVEKPKDKGGARNRVGIMLGFVARSDEVVIGTTERARIVHRMPAGQRGDAAHAKRIRGEPWQLRLMKESRWAWPKLVLWLQALMLDGTKEFQDIFLCKTQRCGKRQAVDRASGNDLTFIRISGAFPIHFEGRADLWVGCQRHRYPPLGHAAPLLADYRVKDERDPGLLWMSTRHVHLLIPPQDLVQ